MTVKDSVRHLLDVSISQSSTLMPLHATRNVRPRREYLCAPPLLFGRRPPQSNYPPCTVPDPDKGPGLAFKWGSTKISLKSLHSANSGSFPFCRMAACNASISERVVIFILRCSDFTSSIRIPSDSAMSVVVSPSKPSSSCRRITRWSAAAR